MQLRFTHFSRATASTAMYCWGAY